MKEIYESRGTEISHHNKHEFNPNVPRRHELTFGIKYVTFLGS